MSAQEEKRRGRAAATRVVAAVRALWLCGTEKCTFDFATDTDSADSGNKARMDLLLSFLTADAVDIRNGLTRVVRLEAGRLVGPVVALAEKIAINLHLRCVCRRKSQGPGRDDRTLCSER